jgi:hypothetical protein
LPVYYLYIERAEQAATAGCNRYKVMPNKLEPKTDPDQPVVYQIKIEGHLGNQWTDWFEGLSITLEGDGDTVITGPVIDQAALHGLLKKVRDLGMPLLSVNRLEPGQEHATETKSSGPVPCN